MIEYVNLVVSFIAGGALLSILTLKLSKISIKADAYQKLELFWTNSNEAIRKEFMERVEELEARISELEKIKCYNIGCKTRQR